MRYCGIAAAVTLAALAACTGEAPISPQTQTMPDTAQSTAVPATADGENKAEDSPALAVEAEGLRLFNKQSGSARAIAFGTSREDVLAILAFRGKPETGANGECGAGTLDYANWPDGLGLFFEHGKLAGWNLNERSKGAITTASGIGPGSSRADLESSYAADISETTLGTEFAAGELYGLLEGKGEAAKITYMWGGISCNFR